MKTIILSSNVVEVVLGDVLQYGQQGDVLIVPLLVGPMVPITARCPMLRPSHPCCCNNQQPTRAQQFHHRHEAGVQVAIVLQVLAGDDDIKSRPRR